VFHIFLTCIILHPSGIISVNILCHLVFPAYFVFVWTCAWFFPIIWS